MDRRSAERCPVCQGPATADKTLADGIRCRRSTCIQNHQNVVCPRCKVKDLESVDFKNGKFTYTCRDCTNTWTANTGP